MNGGGDASWHENDVFACLNPIRKKRFLLDFVVVVGRWSLLVVRCGLTPQKRREAGARSMTG